MWSVRNWIKSIAAEYVADYVRYKEPLSKSATTAKIAQDKARASEQRCEAILKEVLLNKRSSERAYEYALQCGEAQKQCEMILRQAREAVEAAKQAASNARNWAVRAERSMEMPKPSSVSQLIGRINEVDAALEAMRCYVDERIEQEGLVLRGWVNEQLDDVEDGARGLGEYDGAFGIENVTYANLREWQASLTNTARKEALDDALRLPEACEFIAAYRRLYADGREAQSAKRPVIVLRERMRSYDEGMARFAAYVLRCARHHRQAQKQ